MLLLLKNYIFQLLFTVGIIVLFALVIYCINKLFIKLIGYKGYKISLYTGFIGTPVHELGHAIMCVLFGHKIKEIKLYTPKSQNGTLGYVSHSYHKKNIYHQIGNFFIGIGPVIFGALVMLLFMYIFTPAMLKDAGALLFNKTGFDIFAYFKVFAVLFAPKNFLDLRWYLFIILSASVALHMRISPSDIKTSKTGFLYLAAILLVLNIILYIISANVLSAVTSGFIAFGAFMANLLIISIIMSLLILIIALIVKGIVVAKNKLQRRRVR